MQNTNLAEGLKALGGGTKYTYDKPDASLLEVFESPFNASERFNEIIIEAPEFTSLCPKTGQPDFATIMVRYRPFLSCVESKSFKLYLGSFRMHGEFHEACVARIHEDLKQLLNPLALVVEGRFTPRGGIKFWPTVSYVAE